MNNKNRFVLWLIVSAILLSGCWDVHEPERMYYIHGVGIDFKNDEFEVYYQIIDFIGVAKSESPPPDVAQAEVGSAKGKTLDEALFKLYHSLDKRLYWGHLMYLVFSEELVKQAEINSAIDTFNRYRDTRYQTWVYFTKDPVKDVLLTTPILNKGITLSKMGDPMNSYSQESFVEPIDFRKLIIRLNEPSHEVAVPLIAVSEKWETEKGADKITFLKGVGVIAPTEFKGYLEGKQVRGLQWMTEETMRGEVTVKVEEDQGKHYTIVLEKIGVEVKSHVEQGKTVFDIKLSMNAAVSGFQGHAKRKEIEKAVVEEVKKEVLTTYKAGLEKKMDVYRLSEYVYRQHVAAWKMQQQDGKIELTEDSIRHINVHLRKLISGRKTFIETVD